MSAAIPIGAIGALDMLDAIDGIVRRISRVMVAIAGIGLIAIALIVMTEVTTRALDHPLVGAIELIRIVFVISVFFAFAHVITSEREIRVDVLRQFFPGRAGRYLDAAASVITLAFFGFLLWFSVPRLYEHWVEGVYMQGRLLIPMWIPWSTIVIGSFLSAVAALLAVIKHLLAVRADEMPAGGAEEQHHSSL